MSLTIISSNSQLEFFSADVETELSLPYFEGLKAGFPSPADDYIDIAIDLNKELVKNPSSTFYARVKGHSMKDANIHEGDILLIDKSIEPRDNQIAVCFLDGEFTVKRIRISKGKVMLVPANEDFPVILIESENDFRIWGVVLYVIKKM
jgi:DNA polymerase V